MGSADIYTQKARAADGTYFPIPIDVSSNMFNLCIGEIIVDLESPGVEVRVPPRATGVWEIIEDGEPPGVEVRVPPRAVGACGVQQPPQVQLQVQMVPRQARRILGPRSMPRLSCSMPRRLRRNRQGAGASSEAYGAKALKVKTSPPRG